MRLCFVVSLFLLLIALPAAAVPWSKCGATFGTNSGTSLGNGSSICVDFIDGDLTSTILHVGHCENYDIVYDCDILTSAACDGSAVTLQVFGCVMPSVSANHCDPTEGLTFTGIPPNSTGKGDGNQWIYAKVSGNPGADKPRLLVHCND